MPIEKGGAWGAAGALPPGAPVIETDAAGRAVIEAAWKAHSTPPTIGLAGGDLCRTVGGRGDIGRLNSPEAQTLPCDAMEVRIDGTTYLAIAHCIVRRRWLFGPVTAVMNAAWLGEWNVAPRSHPGDGRLDALTATAQLGPLDRARAKSRLPHGGHVPHPAIEQTRVTASRTLTLDLRRPTPVYLDGERVAAGTSIEVSVLPDFFAVVV